MNPPPIPRPEETRNSIAHWAAKASLIAPAVLFLWGLSRAIIAQQSHTPYRGTALSGMMDGTLILIGFIAAIVGLAGIPAYGKPGLFGPGIAGLIINGVLIAIFGIVFAAYQQKAATSRKAIKDLPASTPEIRSNLKKYSKSTNDVTYPDIEMIDKFSAQLKNASRNLSGNDAKSANVMLEYLSQKRSALKTFHDSVTDLSQARVLANFDPNDKGQFAARREVVQRFLNANSDLIQMTTNEENIIRAELVKAQVSEHYIESFIAGFHLTTVAMNALTVQVHQCDDRMGRATIHALNTLEAQWGHWKVDRTSGQLIFNDTETSETFHKFIADIDDAASDEAKLQAEEAKIQPAPAH